MQFIRAMLFASLFCLAALAPAARAELQIDITQGVTDPIPIAIVPFSRAVPADGGLDVSEVVRHDLDGSGRFRSMAIASMLSQPTRADDVQIADWRAAGNDYVLVGRVTSTADGQLTVVAELVNALTGQRLGNAQLSATAVNLRNAAHQVSDFVYQKLIGARGAFATRIAYVSVTGNIGAQRYTLIVADADGENPKVILDSDQPIMSPAWSADGQWLAYVSFENRISSIFVQRLRTGERRQVSARVGVNGAPAWSPDGQRLALVLSGSGGNLDVYVLELATQTLQRITDNPAIDTEPVWSPDGSMLYFTSDRSGGPQIYRCSLANPQRVERLTFGSSYNARARLSPDGKQLAYVTRLGSDYRIAVQDLASGDVRVLSRGSLDESPSFAPNGMSVIYSARQGELGVLATVSVDGLVTQRLKSSQAEVREPVWGPFTP
jgi:TolB protein